MRTHAELLDAVLLAEKDELGVELARVRALRVVDDGAHVDDVPVAVDGAVIRYDPCLETILDIVAAFTTANIRDQEAERLE